MFPQSAILLVESSHTVIVAHNNVVCNLDSENELEILHVHEVMNGTNYGVT